MTNYSFTPLTLGDLQYIYSNYLQNHANMTTWFNILWQGTQKGKSKSARHRSPIEGDSDQISASICPNLINHKYLPKYYKYLPKFNKL